MSRAIYTVDATTAVSLVSTVPKTALAIIAPSSFGLDLLNFSISFNGVSPTEVSVFWELCYLTGATNSTPGTANTNETSNIVQESGRTITPGVSAFSASTTEPTVLTPFETSWLTPNSSFFKYDYPIIGGSPDSAVSNGFALRLTAPATASARVWFRFARC